MDKSSRKVGPETMKVTIIVSGNMGNGIGTRIIAGGHTLEVLNQDGEKAKELAARLGPNAQPGEFITGDVVIFVLLYSAIPQVIEMYKD